MVTISRRPIRCTAKTGVIACARIDESFADELVCVSLSGDMTERSAEDIHIQVQLLEEIKKPNSRVRSTLSSAERRAASMFRFKMLLEVGVGEVTAESERSC